MDDADADGVIDGVIEVGIGVVVVDEAADEGGGGMMHPSANPLSSCCCSVVFVLFGCSSRSVALGGWWL